MQQRAPIQVRFVKIKLSVFVPAWGNGTGREHEIFCVSAETEHITRILLLLHADKSLSFLLVSKCLICDCNGYFQNNSLSLNFMIRHTRISVRRHQRTGRGGAGGAGGAAAPPVGKRIVLFGQN